MKNWEDVKIAPEFNEQGVACYRLTGADFLNEYYIISEAETRKLLNTPEIVGYEVYNCLISSTSQMLYYLKEQKKVTTANILSILRGALNYPLEESCYREHIRVHDISFLSSERVFENEEIAGLEIKYSKLTMVPDSTLMIGDIIASGETLIHCLRYVTDFYREHGAKLRNIIIFTIGGTKGIDILEDLTRDIREFWPEFEGFITVYYEGIFATYQDKGVSGINLPDVDFYWKGGIVAPEFRGKRCPCAARCLKSASFMTAARDAMRFTSTWKKCWSSGRASGNAQIRSIFRSFWKKSSAMSCRSAMRTGLRQTTTA